MIHKFEQAGLGLAPFSYVGMHEKVYVPCPGAPAQPAGTCQYCGNGIRYCCNIRSADGKEFIVGTDCVRKVYSVTNVARMESDVQKLAREKRQAAAAARKAKRQAEYAAKLQEQRDRNGGKTDWEVKAEAERAEREALRTCVKGENQWLIDVLNRQPGSFCYDMAKELETRKLSSMSPRCLSILEDIYAKNFGRGGSKANQAAREEFQGKVGK